MYVQSPLSGSSSALPGPSLEAAVKLWSMRVSRQSVGLTRSGFFLPLALPCVSNCISLFWEEILLFPQGASCALVALMIVSQAFY